MSKQLHAGVFAFIPCKPADLRYNYLVMENYNEYLLTNMDTAPEEDAGQEEPKRIRTLPGIVVLPAVFLWLEFFIAYLRGTFPAASCIAGAAAACVSAGMLVGGVFSLLPPRLNRFLTAAVVQLLILFYCVQYFCQDSYSVYMNIPALLSGAEGVAEEYGQMVVSAILGSAGIILGFEMPFILVILFRKRLRYSRTAPAKFAAAAVCVLLIQAFSVSLLTRQDFYRDKYLSQYTFDDSVRNFGLLTACRLDAVYAAKGVPAAVLPAEEDLPGEGSTETEPEIQQEKVYGFNTSYTDYELLQTKTSDRNLLTALSYASASKPSRKNECTGLFAGKNLIIIAAESFSPEVVDSERTPALYRLASKGIQFEEFYHPFWGGSTTTGEASILLGLIPTDGVESIQRTIGKDNSYTIASRQAAEGYSTMAFHNGKPDYYNRNKTHPGLGYESFTARDGLSEYTLSWPGSDDEMFRSSVGEYIDKGPFSVYYMTISGHGLYNFSGHTQAIWHKDEVADLPYSDTVKAFYAANMDLERGLEYLFEQLEDKGIADDTVIVLTADHYPYALQAGEAWKNTRNYLAELKGFAYRNAMERDRNALYIWCGSLEKEEPIRVTGPTYTPDILPTLCNLFGLKFDSELMVGRDVFSQTEPLVIWPDCSWKSALGFYDASRGTFTPDGDSSASDSYISRLKQVAAAKVSYSRALLNCDFYGFLNENR